MKTLFEHLDPRLLARVRLQLAITQCLRRLLPEPLNVDCWCGSIEEEVMTLVTSDSAQATLIHCQQRELLKQINAEFRDDLVPPLRQIRVQVAARRAGHEQ